MKSLQLGMHWFPERQGGLDRVYYELSRALPGAGVAVCGLVSASPQVVADTAGAVRPFAPRNTSLPRRWAGMRRTFPAMVRDQKPDLIAAHFALYALPLLGQLRARPFIMHFHGPWADEGAVEGNAGLRHRAKRWIENLVYRRATSAIVLSQAFADVLATRYAYPREKIHIIPGGIDYARFAIPETRDAARAHLGWEPSRPTLVAVRRLVPRMGLENLITAIASLRATIPDIQLLIAGRGMLQTQLEAQIAQLSLANHVRLIGFVKDEDLPYVYRAADISVVPTVALEGFGLIAAESLAAGTPCLVSPIGGLPEVVSALSPDLVLQSPAPEHITARLHAALTGATPLPTEAECRAYAAQHFDWPIIAARTAEIYRQALA